MTHRRRSRNRELVFYRVPELAVGLGPVGCPGGFIQVGTTTLGGHLVAVHQVRPGFAFFSATARFMLALPGLGLWGRARTARSLAPGT